MSPDRCRGRLALTETDKACVQPYSCTQLEVHSCHTQSTCVHFLFSLGKFSLSSKPNVSSLNVSQVLFDFLWLTHRGAGLELAGFVIVIASAQFKSAKLFSGRVLFEYFWLGFGRLGHLEVDGGHWGQNPQPFSCGRNSTLYL